MDNLLKAASELISLVEGVKSIGHKWASNNIRFKDTKEWVMFYNAYHAHAKVLELEEKLKQESCVNRCEFCGSYQDKKHLSCLTCSKPLPSAKALKDYVK